MRRTCQGTRAALAAGALAACGPAHDVAPPNLVLVSMDTCRWDHTGLAGYARDTTPNLEALAAQGVSFSRTWAPSNETAFSHAALFTAREPRDLAPLDDHFHLPEQAASLPEILGTWGYATAGFTGGAYVKRDLGFARGFDVYQDDVDFGSFYHSVQAAEAWLGSAGPGPFFLFVHGYDCHAPYRKPLAFEDLFDPAYRGIADEIAEDPLGAERIWNRRYYPGLEGEFALDDAGRPHLTDDFVAHALARAEAQGRLSVPLTQADLDHLVAHYDGALVYADLFLGLLLARLEALGLADGTVVAVVADHGEGLADHPYFPHRPNLREAVLRVPFVLAGPGVPVGPAGGEEAPARLVDVAPTLLELAGIPALQGVLGQSLLPLLRGEGPGPAWPVLAESRTQISARAPGLHVVVDKAGIGVGPDLMPEAVHAFAFPDEVAADAPAPSPAALAEQARAWYAARRPLDGSGTFTTDDALRRTLRERGYW